MYLKQIIQLQAAVIAYSWMTFRHRFASILQNLLQNRDCFRYEKMFSDCFRIVFVLFSFLFSLCFWIKAMSHTVR